MSEAPAEDQKKYYGGLAMAQEALMERGRIAAVAFIEKDRNVFAHYADFSSGAAKDHFVSVIKLLSIAKNAESVTFVSEAWGLPGTTEEEIEANKKYVEEHGTIADHPDKVEVIQIVTYTDAGQLFGSTNISRTESNHPYVRPEDVKEPDFIPIDEVGERIQGRMSQLLAPKKFRDDPETRAKAQLILKIMGFGEVLVEDVLADAPKDEFYTSKPN